MGFLGRLFGSTAPARAGSPRNDLAGDNAVFFDINDPRMIEFMRDGMLSASGFTVNAETALRNPAMFRACSLISNSIGMLPFNLIDKATKKKAVDHPLHRVLHRKPNDWQSAFDFRAQMQLRALVHRDAYALNIWSRDLRSGRDKVLRMVPLDPKRMEVRQNDDWSVSYLYQPKTGGRIAYRPRDIFHLRGMSLDGLHGFSLVEQAREAIGLALSAELAAGRIFRNGAFVDGVLVSTDEMSDPAYERLKISWAERFAGAANAGKTPILEKVDYKPVGSTAKDAQMTELRKLQVEEIARVSGVPRPLLMVDETAWGTGIYALGQFFVAYALGPWFEAWEQAVARTMLSDEENDLYEPKFNPAALLRGSMKEQGEFLARALGAGGHAPWMHVDEVRDVLDLPDREAPPHAMMGRGNDPIVDDPDRPAPKKKDSTDED